MYVTLIMYNKFKNIHMSIQLTLVVLIIRIWWQSGWLSPEVS